MNKFKRLSWVSVIFLALFLLVSLPIAQSVEAKGNAPILVTAPEATIPLTANAVTGATEAECPYTLTFKLAGVALHREKNKSQGLNSLFFSGPGVAESAQIGAGDLNLGWAPGMDTSLMLQNECYGIELRYLGLHQWEESKTDSFFVPDVVDGIASGQFKSALHNAELNLHWWPCANDRYSLLMGFRWLRLKDRLSTFGEIDAESFLTINVKDSLSCRNDLWGGQVGVEGLLFGKRDQGFSVDGGVKAGVFANKIRNKESDSTAINTDGDLVLGVTTSDSWNRTKTAFLSEVVLNANYAFTKNIAMTVGYQFLYVNKVAVPVNNWGSTQSVIFNGGRLGLNFVF